MIPRIPTRPGWWLIEANPRDTSGGRPYEIIEVVRQNDRLLIVGRSPRRVDERPDIVWVAEVPGPAVLAALEDCVAAEHAWANGNLDDERLERAVTNAEARLYAAIRAERDEAQAGQGGE
mgnify:FL=1